MYTCVLKINNVPVINLIFLSFRICAKRKH